MQNVGLLMAAKFYNQIQWDGIIDFKKYQWDPTSNIVKSLFLTLCSFIYPDDCGGTHEPI